MKHEIGYLYEGNNSEKKSYRVSNVIVKKIVKGVHLIYIDFNKRMFFDGLGSDGEGEYIYFGDEDEILIEIKLPVTELGGNGDCWIFGDVAGSTFNGTIYTYDKYCELLEG